MGLSPQRAILLLLLLYYYYYWCKLDIRGKVQIYNVQPITRQYTIYYVRTQVTYKTYGRTQVKYKDSVQSPWLQWHPEYMKEKVNKKQTKIKAL